MRAYNNQEFLRTMAVWDRIDVYNILYDLDYERIFWTRRLTNADR